VTINLRRLKILISINDVSIIRFIREIIFLQGAVSGGGKAAGM